MKVMDSFRFLGGATATYVVMAACGSGSGGGMLLRTDGGRVRVDGASGTHIDGSGRDEASIDGNGRGIIDALTDPVSPAMADNANISGSRLKVQRYVGSDGSSVLAGLYDSQLASPCSVVLAADGTTRCLPITVPVEYFGDSGCTQPVASGSCSSPAPTYAFTSASSCMQRMYVVYPVTGVHAGAVYSGGPGACTMLPALPGGGTAYDLGSEMSSSSFVEMTLTTDP
jgi:hypothetical protein